MDEEQKRHPLLKILLLDIGVAGTSIFGALGIIVIAFILLNYFNILSLSDLYPKYLSLLPHQTTTQPPPKPLNMQSTASNLYNNLSPSELNKFSSIEQEFADKILQPPYRTTVNLSRDFFVKSKILSNSAFYAWNVSGIPLQVSAYYEENKILVASGLTISVSTTPDATSSSSASIFVQKFVILPSSQMEWLCKNSPEIKISECNSMTTQEDKSKLGISLTFNTQPKQNNTASIINICQIFPSSNRYSWSTCLHE